MLEGDTGMSYTTVMERGEVGVRDEEAECGSMSDGYSVDSTAEYYKGHAVGFS